MTSSGKSISAAEVQSHKTQESCWIVIEGQVYDFTRFAPEHPGGAEIIYSFAGRDATQAYLEVHVPSLLKSNLLPHEHIGTLDPTTALPDEPPSKVDRKGERPPLETFINAYDFENAAKESFSEKTWAFVSGASNDNITRDVGCILPLSCRTQPAVHVTAFNETNILPG